ncbi:MAG: XTP/dITP diphosphatase [Butyrivibrio sp.]|nr:XTP/dITP diphosphatase [Butyrivibrio sp.]
MKIVFATGNKDKMREIKQILGNLPVEIISMKEAGIDIDIEENGTTFEENALIKAKAVADRCDAIVLADDSGLEIDCLGKEPGVYSARYLGRETPYPEKNAIILDRIKDVEDKDRSARFVCAIAAVLPDGRDLVVRGTMEGMIGHEIAGENGFGYDPIFFLPEYGKTSAQLSPDEKNAVSHRGKALRMMADRLSEILK